MGDGTRFFLAENDERILRIEEINLKANGHQIIVKATSFEEAMAGIQTAREQGVNIAIVDGDLGHGREDGFLVATALREAIPNIKIISFPSVRADWGNINLIKPNTPGVFEAVNNIKSEATP